MEKKKREAQDAIIKSIVIVVAVIAFIGGFVLSGDLKERVFRAKSRNESDDNGFILTAGGTTKKSNTLGFDQKYIVGDSENQYDVLFGTYSGLNGNYINIEYGNTKSQLNLVEHSYDGQTEKDHLVTFSANVVDVHMSTFDLDSDLNTIFVLLDSGKVEYIMIEDAMTTETYKSYGTLDLDQVIKFYEGTNCDRESDYCIKTAFAQTANGNIYDLYEYIKK